MQYQHVSSLGGVTGGWHINSKSPYVRLYANKASPRKLIIHSSILGHLLSNPYYTCPEAGIPSRTYTFRRKLKLRMYGLTCFVVLATIFNNSYAKTITIENRVFSGNDRVQIGNIECAQDIYIYRNITRKDNARVQLGDIVARECVPPGGAKLYDIYNRDNCRMHIGNHYIDDKVDCDWCDDSGLVHEKP
jgi:hypothetical protein